MNSLELKLCEIQGKLFELFSNTEYDSESLVKAFMNGNLAQNLDSKYNRMQWAGEEYILEELIETSKEKLLKRKDKDSTDSLFWIGYVYRYWHFYTNEESSKIYKQAPYETMKTNFLMFHTMDIELVIDDLKEIYNQKKR